MTRLARGPLALVVGCAFALLIVLHAPVMSVESETVPKPVQVPADLCEASVSFDPSRVDSAQAGVALAAIGLPDGLFASCNPPAGCATPDLYCSCIANGYPQWVCAFYGC